MARISAAQTAPARIEPFAGYSTTGEVTPGGTDRYELALASGQFVDLTVAAAPDALVVSLLDPDGKERIRLPRETTPDGTRRLCDIAPGNGTYTIVVTAASGDKRRPYTLRVLDVRDALEPDRARAAAVEAFAEAERLALRRSHRNAIPQYERAVAQWQTAGDTAEEAMALFRLASAYGITGQFPQSVDANLRSAALRHELGDRRAEGIALNNAGAESYGLADYPMARRYYEQALTLRRETGDRNGEAYSVSGLGNVYQSTGDIEKALEQYQQATALWQAAGNRAGEAMGLNNIGGAYRLLGHFQEALEFYTRALERRRAMGNKSGMAQTLTQIGNLRVTLGAPDTALEAYEEALALSGSSRGRAAAYTISAMGTALADLGNWDAALERFSAAGDIFRRIGDRDGEARALLSTGQTWLKRGEPERAIEPLESAQTLYRAIGGRRSIALAGVSIADAYSRLVRLDAAVQHYDAAAAVFHAVRDRHGEMKALAGLAAVERRLDRLADARDHADAAVALVESLRASVDSEELRTSYLAEAHSAFGVYVDIEMQLDAREPGRGHLEAALRGSERARARGLLDLLTDARLTITRGVDAALVDRERQLSIRVEQTGDRLTRALSAAPGQDAIASAERDADAAMRELREVQQQIKSRSPQYAELTQPLALDAHAIQRGLDADTVLLEYMLGPERSYVWTVTRDALRGAALPPRAEIEDAARRAYDLVARGAHRETRFQTDRALDRLALLVLAPVAPALTRTRVVIVADGALQYVPFAALPAPGGADGRAPEPLVAAHEVVTLPSASALDALRRADRAPADASRELAVFADPVLTRDDPRVGNRAGSDRHQTGVRRRSVLPSDPAPLPADAKADDAWNSARESGLASLDRLPFTRAEAAAIADFAPRDGTLAAFGFEATRAAALSEIGRYRLVHFATHALLNSQHPEQSGIVLSMVDRGGTPVDGFLRLRDVYNLRLAADLVVLSACRTALGKEVRGEGLVGLTRGFFYAGAPAVIASLWDVRDRSTAELMTRFYRAMLRDRLTPAAALRAAQTSMWRDPRWSSPAHWAGFILQGDWRAAR